MVRLIKVIGLDLAGSEKNPTGYCHIEFSEVVAFGELYSDASIKRYISKIEPDIVAIDAPLNFPSHGNLRDCDLLMKQIGLNPFPPTMPGMRVLVERAMRLVNWLEENGFSYIEVFPAGAIHFLGLKRKPRSIGERIKMARELVRLIGLSMKFRISKMSPDEFDAVICAITGYAYLTGNYIEIKGRECTVIFPAEPSAWKV